MSPVAPRTARILISPQSESSAPTINAFVIRNVRRSAESPGSFIGTLRNEMGANGAGNVAEERKFGIFKLMSDTLRWTNRQFCLDPIENMRSTLGCHPRVLWCGKRDNKYPHPIYMKGNVLNTRKIVQNRTMNTLNLNKQKQELHSVSCPHLLVIKNLKEKFSLSNETLVIAVNTKVNETTNKLQETADECNI